MNKTNIPRHRQLISLLCILLLFSTLVSATAFADDVIFGPATGEGEALSSVTVSTSAAVEDIEKNCPYMCTETIKWT